MLPASAPRPLPCPPQSKGAQRFQMQGGERARSVKMRKRTAWELSASEGQEGRDRRRRKRKPCLLGDRGVRGKPPAFIN